MKNTVCSASIKKLMLCIIDASYFSMHRSPGDLRHCSASAARNERPWWSIRPNVPRDLRLRPADGLKRPAAPWQAYQKAGWLHGTGLQLEGLLHGAGCKGRAGSTAWSRRGAAAGWHCQPDSITEDWACNMARCSGPEEGRVGEGCGHWAARGLWAAALARAYSMAY